MTQKTFNVKDKSLQAFFKEYHAGADELSGRDINPYYFFKDEMILKRPAFPVDTVVVFELEDQTKLSARKLINIYQYHVEAYDDVSLKLILTDFKIRLHENETFAQ